MKNRLLFVGFIYQGRSLDFVIHQAQIMAGRGQNAQNACNLGICGTTEPNRACCFEHDVQTAKVYPRLAAFRVCARPDVMVTGRERLCKPSPLMQANTRARSLVLIPATVLASDSSCLRPSSSSASTFSNDERRASSASRDHLTCR